MRGPVLFVSYAGLWGGAERALLDVLTRLDEPAVLLCPGGELADRARAAGIVVLERPIRPLERRATNVYDTFVAHCVDVRRAVRALRPRAVVAWNMRSGIACAAVVRGQVPLVFQHSDFLPPGPVAAAVRAAARAADVVIVNSAAVAAELGTGVVVHPGVDVDAFAAVPEPAGDPVVLWLGAIVPWKRPDLALEAVALVPGVRLILAGHAVGEGSGPLLEALRRRAAEPDLAGRVEFPGAVRDPAQALARASVLLHTAGREPFGLVVVEALAAGRPVVAPDAGGPREIVTPDCGRLFTPGDAKAAASALREVMAEPPEQTRARAAAFRADVAAAAWRAAVRPLIPGDEAPAVDLTLVVVTHDSAPELARLLATARRHLPDAPVIVADSGSSDDTVAVAQRAGATVLDCGDVGYGRAANAGVAAVTTPACAVLNPDVELLDASLAALAAEALRPDRPDRLLAPLVLNPDGTRQDTAHPEPISLPSAVRALVPPAALPRRLRARLEPWHGDQPRPVAWAVGCCLVARTGVLRRLGPFDHNLFLYAEDLDLGLRARDAGVATWWWPQARIVHAGAHASRRAFAGEPVRLLAHQRHVVVARRRGRVAANADDLLQALTFADRLAIKRLLGRPAARERAQIAALWELR